MGTVSEKIAQWVYAITYDSIPQEVVNVAKRCILDLIGVTLAGSREQAAQIIRQYVAEVKGTEESTVIGLGTRTTRTEAAFANGTLGHLLDYDDLIHPMPGGGGPHITAVVLPAALAIAEKGHKTGKQLLEAYILGTEVTHRLGRAIEPFHFLHGWHNTETEGIFGATVAASKLLNLDCEKITNALGITASEASGLRQNFGTMTKPFHAGQANSKAVRAAILAKLGFTSSNIIFEGKYGFFNVMCKDARINEFTDNLGQPFLLPLVKLKLYPCCGGSHCSIDATLGLVNENKINPEDIERVTAINPPLVETALIYDDPHTALEGKFSVQFPLALAILEKKVTMDNFTDDKIKEPAVISLMKKIKLVCTEELARTDSTEEPSIVEIELKDGRKLVKRVDYAKGSPPNNLSDEELFRKYRTCARKVLTEKETEKSLDLIMNLERIENIGNLTKIIRG
jgi:2-methylcitrate dehydratase PrpD